MLNSLLRLLLDEKEKKFKAKLAVLTHSCKMAPTRDPQKLQMTHTTLLYPITVIGLEASMKKAFWDWLVLDPDNCTSVEILNESTRWKLDMM